MFFPINYFVFLIEIGLIIILNVFSYHDIERYNPYKSFHGLLKELFILNLIFSFYLYVSYKRLLKRKNNLFDSFKNVIIYPVTIRLLIFLFPLLIFTPVVSFLVYIFLPEFFFNASFFVSLLALSHFLFGLFVFIYWRLSKKFYIVYAILFCILTISFLGSLALITRPVDIINMFVYNCVANDSYCFAKKHILPTVMRCVMTIK